MEYYSENAKKELESRKAKAEALAKAWGEVKRVYKKNGEQFVNIAKNFTGTNIKMPNYSNYKEEKAAFVYTTDATGKSHSDYINIYKTLERNEEEKAEKEGREIVQRGAWLKPFYILSVEEVEEACKERAAYYKREAEEVERVLQDFEKIAGELVELRGKAYKICENYGTFCEYVLKSIVREVRI